MHSRRLSPLVLLCLCPCLGLLSIACTPAARWGTRAFYSPAHRGYVIAAEAPDDRPAAWTQTIVLTDPLEGDKLVCREEVERFLDARAKAASDEVTRENVTLAMAIGLLPVTSVGVLGLSVAGLSSGYVLGPGRLAAPDAEGRYHEGMDALREKRWRAVRQKLEEALSGSEEIRRTTKALFQLGRAYEETGEPAMAARSYRAFVRRAWIPAEAEYMRAEAYLADLGEDPPECASRDELEVVWP